jgi:pimeloyl-ACP methyl ester carboxylesterase
VIVPGITGSKLCSKSTGELLWGSFWRLMFPWDGGRSLVGDDVVPCGPIREIRIGHYSKDIYGGLLDFLSGEGFRTHFFDYDWREDNVISAQKLAERLRGLDDVTLICQSNGTYICRYLVRYLEAADIDKLIMIGTANGGAVRILREMNDGRQYIRWIGRRMRPSTLFTFRSLYQDLPAVPHGEVDVFDPENWTRYGWSDFSAEQATFLRDALANARSLHQKLRADTGRDLPVYYSIQSRDFATLSQIEPPDGFVSEEMGDRHATLTSQQWLAPEETAALEELIFVRGLHFEMITTDETRGHILRVILSREVGEGPPDSRRSFALCGDQDDTTERRPRSRGPRTF